MKQTNFYQNVEEMNKDIKADTDSRLTRLENRLKALNEQIKNIENTLAFNTDADVKDDSISNKPITVVKYNHLHKLSSNKDIRHNVIANPADGPSFGIANQQCKKWY